MMSKIKDFIILIIAGVLMVGCLYMLGVCVYCEVSKQEVEVFSVGCEVSQMAYAEEIISRSTSRPVYKMGVRNDEFAATIEITDTQFAKYVVGDIVEVEVRVYENGLGGFTYEYKLLDEYNEIYFN